MPLLYSKCGSLDSGGLEKAFPAASLADRRYASRIALHERLGVVRWTTPYKTKIISM